MISKYYSPPPTSLFVEKYLTIEHQGQVDNLTKELILPDGTAGLLFMTTGSISRSDQQAQNGIQLNKVYLFGQKTKAVHYQLPTDNLYAFGAKLKPQALHQLFGISGVEWTDTLVDMEMIVGRSTQLFEEQINEAPNLIAKIKVVEQMFQQFYHSSIKHEALMDLILQDIKNSGGNISIAALAKKYNCSYKFLERLFRRFIGMNPKMYARIVRFNTSFYTFKHNHSSKLTDLAYNCGYFDQMHFIKEVQWFSGRNPSELYIPPSTPMEKAQWDFMSAYR